MTGMDIEQQDKATTRKRCRGITRKTLIIKNRSKGIKLAIKYNVDGVYVGQAAMHLTSYLAVLAGTMVPIRYSTCVTPQTPGSVDSPSTRRIHVAIKCLNATK